ncbi:MAG: exodeoxyribonuclease VII large subunit [Bacillota bacterium]|nr:exodeoxyribonuclease VII large subunit [Bacillota bacterium]
MPERKPVTVSQLNYYLKKKIEGDENLRNIWVEGEISNCKIYSSGHMYFGLKDEGSFLKAVMFRSSVGKLAFKPENGQKVIVKGAISVYERDGQYQIIATSMEAAGIGDLYLAYEQLKRRLNEEGLFALSHKKDIPLYSPRIGVVTSPTGAVWHDIQNVATARFPSIALTLYPSAVQGDAAEAEVIAGIRYFNRVKTVDLLIVGRGGGSIEDLWTFNTEGVARAIYESELPIISAVGHETDTTIADLVADKRAATPSQAAEMAVPSLSDLENRLAMLKSGLIQRLHGGLENRRIKLKKLGESPVFTQSERLFQGKLQTIDMLEQRLRSGFGEKYRQKVNEYQVLKEKLAVLSPLNTLERGYSICLKDGKPLRDSAQAVIGDKVAVQLKKGHIICRVTEGKEGSVYDQD